MILRVKGELVIPTRAFLARSRAVVRLTSLAEATARRTRVCNLMSNACPGGLSVRLYLADWLAVGLCNLLRTDCRAGFLRSCSVSAESSEEAVSSRGRDGWEGLEAEEGTRFC